MYAVIMAGGKGERFWPLSRCDKPKQFLSLLGQRTMLQMTADRLQGLLPPANIYVVTDLIYQELVREQLPELPPGNIILEHCGRDTAAAVGLAAAYIQRQDPEGMILVLPADHFIADTEEFHRLLHVAVRSACSGKYVVTIGIRPTRPETGYGYIQQGEAAEDQEFSNVYKTIAFHEKPDLKTAVEYIQHGNYLWNSGMFVWRVDLLLQLIAEYLPDLNRGLAVISEVIGTEREAEVIREVYEKLPRISIDYGIMEKCQQVLVIPAAFGWDDIGSWTALGRYRESDHRGNILQGRGVFLDTHDCMVYAPQRIVATLGVEGLIIVDNQDSLLVCSKDRAQEIKKVVEALKEAGYSDII
ncbi:mannose-1-phosphate guanylyltransferase (gdp) [hydrocarbon metagenome]|uniref:Mannose-1-phosphate guanylyltransferase (Gdp) n=1 Tax=hydrocarbon metagenome TaxID=938273 RepID=A0A0W8E312_9ZZZZ